MLWNNWRYTQKSYIWNETLHNFNGFYQFTLTMIQCSLGGPSDREAMVDLPSKIIHTYVPRTLFKYKDWTLTRLYYCDDILQIMCACGWKLFSTFLLTRKHFGVKFLASLHCLDACSWSCQVIFYVSATVLPAGTWADRHQAALGHQNK